MFELEGNGMNNIHKNTGRSVLALCAIMVVVATTASLCRAAESDAGRYQWQIVPIENQTDAIYVVDTETGIIIKWNHSQQEWNPSDVISLPDWDDIRKQKERAIKAQAENALREKEVKAKRDAAMEAFLKAFSEMPLEEQVVVADDIYVIYPIKDSRSSRKEDLKRRGKYLAEEPSRGRPLLLPEYRRTAEGKQVPSLPRLSDEPPPPLAPQYGEPSVYFRGDINGGSFSFRLSHTEFDNKKTFPAPETIVEDVKAEIKRQAEK